MAPVIVNQGILPLGEAVEDSFLKTAQQIRAPSLDYILKICGPNIMARAETIESACHGFEEMPSMKDILPFINWTEAIYLMAVLFNGRKNPYFLDFAKSSDLKGVLHNACAMLDADARIDSASVPNKFEAEHMEMNPYSRSEKNSMFKRVSLAPSRHTERFMSDVRQPSKRYVYVPYHGRIDPNTVVMYYQMNSPRFDRHGRMFETDRKVVNTKFAEQMKRIFSRY